MKIRSEERSTYRIEMELSHNELLAFYAVIGIARLNEEKWIQVGQDLGIDLTGPADPRQEVINHLEETMKMLLGLR